jgi:sigma-E factor negative regulatory protein RseC
MDCIEEGIVTRTMGTMAEVTATRAEACQACSSKGTCEALGGSTSKTVVKATNVAGAAVGDRVAVAMPGRSIVGAAGLLYFFPAVALLGGAALGQLLATRMEFSVNLGGVLGAVLFLVVSFALVALVGRRLGRRQDFIPEISRVTVRGDLDDGQAESDPDAVRR